MIIYQLWLVNLKPVKPVCVCFGQTFGWMLLCSIVLEELNAVPLLWATDVCWRVFLDPPQSSTRLDRKSLEPWENNTWGQGRASCSSSQSLTEEGKWRLSSQLHFSLRLFAHLCLQFAATHSFLLSSGLFALLRRVLSFLVTSSCRSFSSFANSNCSSHFLTFSLHLL